MMQKPRRTGGHSNTDTSQHPSISYTFRGLNYAKRSTSIPALYTCNTLYTCAKKRGCKH